MMITTPRNRYKYTPNKNYVILCEWEAIYK